jgi:membrane protein implicated in regulation of membrane protease activity
VNGSFLIQWWLWLVIGFALCVAELLLPALVLIWLGIAALILGLLLLVIPLGLTAQLLLWTVLSAGLTWLWLRVFKNTPTDSRIGSSCEILGEVGLLVKDVEPFARGEILFQRPLLGSDRWSCTAEVRLVAGSRARVVAVEGNALKVVAA